MFRVATGRDGQTKFSIVDTVQILNPLIEPSKRQTGRDPRFGRLKEPLPIKHDFLKVLVHHVVRKTV